MNKISVLLGVTLFSLALSGCGMFSKEKAGPFKNYSRDYLKSSTVTAISVPDDMAQPSFTPLYPVKDAAGKDEFGDPAVLAEYEVPRPQSINSVDESFSIKIQRLGEQSWLALNAPTGQVWPQLQNFLNASGVPTISSSAKTGLIETDWLKFTNDTENKVRYQLRLEKGLHPDSTEIHILQMMLPMEAETTLDVEWPERSQSQEKEQWMLEKIANALVDSINNASASLLGQYVGGDLKAGFAKGAEEPTMQLRLSADRAWASLLGSAQKDGFVLWGRDATKGVIYVGFDPTATEEKGFWSKALSFGKDKVPAEARYSVDELLQNLSGSDSTRQLFSEIKGAEFGTALSKIDEGFLVVMKDLGTHFSVIVRDQRGRVIPRDEAKALMRLLRKNLS